MYTEVAIFNIKLVTYIITVPVSKDSKVELRNTSIAYTKPCTTVTTTSTTK